jgi:hypothetical protein
MVERIPMKFVIVLAVLATCGLVSSIIEQPTDLTFLYSFGLLMLIGASFARIFPPKGIAKDRRRLTLFLLSASAMFAWPLSLFYGIHATLMLKSILKAQMLDYPLLPRLWLEVVFWMGLGPILPFVAAWLLKLAKKQRQSEEARSSVRGYLVCLGISILGSAYLAPSVLILILLA